MLSTTQKIVKYTSTQLSEYFKYDVLNPYCNVVLALICTLQDIYLIEWIVTVHALGFLLEHENDGTSIGVYIDAHGFIQVNVWGYSEVLLNSQGKTFFKSQYHQAFEFIKTYIES